MRSARLLTGLVSMALLVVGLVALLPDCASACTCATSAPPERALEESSAVFSGEVIDIEKPPPPTTFKMAEKSKTMVTLRVSEVWKGSKRETLEVSTHSQESACGYSFSEGRKYLVYAEGKGMKVNACGETTPLSKASADLEALGNGEKPQDGGEGEVLSDTSGGLSVGTVVGLAGLTLAASFLVVMRLVRSG